MFFAVSGFSSVKFASMVPVDSVVIFIFIWLNSSFNSLKVFTLVSSIYAIA